MGQRKEFRIAIPNERGQIWRLCDALFKRKVNLKTVAGFAAHFGILAIITDQEDVTREVLQELGLKFQEIDLLTIKLTDMPGEIAYYAKKLHDADINIEALYMVGESRSGGEIAMAVSDLERAQRVLGQ